MPEYQQRKRNAARGNGDDSGIVSPIPTSVPHTAQEASSSAGSTISNIDNLLGQERTPNSAPQTGGLYRPEADSPAVLNSAEKGSKPAADATSGGGVANSTGSDAAASVAGVAGGGLYSGVDSPRNLLKKIVLTRRKTAAGILVSMLTGGLLFSGIIASGPLEVIHFGQVLEKSFSLSDSQSSNRVGHLFRYARAAKAGDIRLTRLGYVGYKVFGNTLTQLKAAGVEIKPNIIGSTSEITIDTENKTLASSRPELFDNDPNVVRDYVSKQFGVKADDVKISGKLIRINASGYDIRASRLITKNTVGFLDDGKLLTGIKGYFLNEAFGNPSALHPLNRKQAQLENKAANALQQRQAEQQAEAERQAAIRDPIAVQGEEAVASIKSKSSIYNGTAAKVLLFTGAVCYIRSTADEIVTVNEKAVALPAAAAATNLVAISAQARDGGKDVTSTQVKEIKNDLTTVQGSSVWKSKAVQDLMTGNSNTVNDDITPDLKAAFSDQSTAANITNGANNAIGGTAVAEAACSSGGIVVQVLGSLALSAASVFGEAASAGTLTPAVVGVWAAKQGAQIALGAVLLHYMTHFIVGHAAKAVLPKTLAGSLGGSIYAYGSRYAANIVSIGAGGVELASNVTTGLLSDAQAQQDQQFRSESFISRIFDAGDNRSVTGHLADMVNPSVYGSFSSGLSGILNINHALASVFSGLGPHAAAASQYDWGFGLAGIPPEVMNNPAFADPYASGDIEAGILSGSNGPSLIERSLSCFGDKISQDSTGTWDVIRVSTPNPRSADYIAHHCNDYVGDADYQRTMMFVGDTMDAKAAACQQGDDQSCADLGKGSAPAVSSTSGTGSPVAASGSAAQLAAQLLKDSNFSPLDGTCPVRNKEDPNDKASCVIYDLQDTAAGKSITNKDTCGNTVSIDANLLQVLLTATSKYKIQPINIISGHGCDEFLHPKGRASDLDFVTDLSSGKTTNFCAPSSNSKYSRVCDQSGDNEALDAQFYNYIASIMPKGSEMGQNTCAGREGLTAPAGVTFFGDGCNHQHIDLGNP